MIPTLYLTRNGLLEPLGQSQVLAYLRGLSRDHKITLITDEKDEDWADTARMAEVRAECEALGIRWLPQRFLPSPRIIAPAFSMIRTLWLVRREVKRTSIRLIHARSYIPAAVAMVAARMTGARFIFDMRALWLEELISSGKLRRGSLLHRLMAVAERACLRSAAGVVSLTYAAADHLKREFPEELANQRIVVIPTCADLSRFTPADRNPDCQVIGCLGTMISGWFRLDWLNAFLATALRHDPGLRIQLTTRDDSESLLSALTPEVGARARIASADPREVPDILRGQTTSVMFFTEGLGKLGSSPTRMGEILGCGLPVVANEGVGDVARIIQEHRVGVLVRSAAPSDMHAAWHALQELLTDPDLAKRCRVAAEAIFSLEAGTKAYSSLYAAILADDDLRASIPGRT